MAAVSTGHAMCVATTQNLLRVAILECQPIRIGASHPGDRSHAVHKRGSSITGVLVTGTVQDSTLVWDSRSTDRDYLAELPQLETGQQSSFFLQGSAEDICGRYVGTERIFITDRPCCDVIPARGLCLLPAPLTIVKEEKSPQRWEKWQPAADDIAVRADPISSAREQVREVVLGIIAADNAGDVRQVVRFYAEGAVLMPPDRPDIVGSDAIRESYERLFAETQLCIEPGIEEIMVSDNQATVRGVNRIRSTGVDTGVTDCFSSKYLMTLQRNPNGDWLISQLMWSNEHVACRQSR